MSKDTPYRAPIGLEVRAPAPQLVVAWSDAERSKWKAFLRGYYGFLAAALGVGAVAAVSPHAAGACAAAGGGYWWFRRRQEVAPGFTLDVVGGSLAIQRAGEPAPVVVELSAVRDVEIERKAIQRVSYHQGYGDAVPSTELSGDLDVARIVVVRDGADPRVRLTEQYAPVFVCLERFGKVRTFLRSHGWKPVGELVRALVPEPGVLGAPEEVLGPRAHVGHPGPEDALLPSGRWATTPAPPPRRP